ncbi:MAG: hypothetical protein JWL84_4906 [Rhodospirillales bacterium]|nr:hypothetical protein [Rhodospirillales bacterium]
MAVSYIYAGVARYRGGRLGGIFRRRADDHDANWEHLTDRLPEAANVQAITIDPNERGVLTMGRRTDPTAAPTRVAIGSASASVTATSKWSITIHPTRPGILYAGTSPVGVWRSKDGGDNWMPMQKLSVPDRLSMPFPCRVMRIAVDPSHPGELYAALEVNGVMRSLDAGESWQDSSDDLIRLSNQPHLRGRLESHSESEGMLDGHAICVSAADPGAVYLAIRMGIFRSANRGETWEDLGIGRFAPYTYSRDIRVSPHDPRVLYCCLSIAAKSAAGALYRSGDLGHSWERFDHRIAPHSTMMGVSIDPRDPWRVCGVARAGLVLATEDAGRTWHDYALPDGCEDVYAIACG